MKNNKGFQKNQKTSKAASKSMRTNNKGRARFTQNKSARSKDAEDNAQAMLGKRGVSGNHGTNDVSWYAGNDVLLRDSASLPYSWPTGNTLNLGDESLFIEDQESSIPGVMQINYVPTYGTSTAIMDPMNVAATSMFEYLAHAVSRNSMPYDAPDIMQFAICMDSISYLMTWCTRLYGAINFYNQQNRYLPESIFKLMHVDFNDFKRNMANFRYNFNRIVQLVNESLRLPADMPIFKRHAFLCANIYAEGSDANSQLYWYNPEGWYNMGQEDVDGVTMPVVKWHSFKTAFTQPMTSENIIDLLEGLIVPLLNNQDIQVMCGDIEKAYGSDKMIKFTSLPEMLILEPVVNTEVLEQMKNTKVYDFNSGCSIVVKPDFDVHQSYDGSHLIQSIHFEGKGSSEYLPAFAEFWSRPKLITTVGEASPAITMINTRNISMPKITTNGNDISFDMLVGSEFFTSFTWIYNKTNGEPRIVDGHGFCVINPSSANYMVPAMQYLNQVANFKYHPEIAVAYYITESYASSNWPTGVYVAPSNWDVDNYAVVDYETLKKIHYAAIQNEFIVPDSFIQPYKNY